MANVKREDIPIIPGDLPTSKAFETHNKNRLKEKRNYEVVRHID